jgi:hypothetical protein
MEHGRAIIVDSLRSVELGQAQPVIYDREIGLRLTNDPSAAWLRRVLPAAPGGA